MKVYYIKESDFDNLLLKIDRDPRYGLNGGSNDSSVRETIKDSIYEEVHKFYNYQVKTWIDSIKRE